VEAEAEADAALAAAARVRVTAAAVAAAAAADGDPPCGARGSITICPEGATAATKTVPSGAVNSEPARTAEEAGAVVLVWTAGRFVDAATAAAADWEGGERGCCASPHTESETDSASLDSAASAPLRFGRGLLADEETGSSESLSGPDTDAGPDPRDPVVRDSVVPGERVPVDDASVAADKTSRGDADADWRGAGGLPPADAAVAVAVVFEPAAAAPALEPSSVAMGDAPPSSAEETEADERPDDGIASEGPRAEVAAARGPEGGAAGKGVRGKGPLGPWTQRTPVGRAAAPLPPCREAPDVGPPAAPPAAIVAAAAGPSAP
jgi:hypothetical protein